MADKKEKAIDKVATTEKTAQTENVVLSYDDILLARMERGEMTAQKEMVKNRLEIKKQKEVLNGK